MSRYESEREDRNSGYLKSIAVNLGEIAKSLKLLTGEEKPDQGEQLLKGIHTEKKCVSCYSSYFGYSRCPYCGHV